MRLLQDQEVAKEEDDFLRQDHNIQFELDNFTIIIMSSLVFAFLGPQQQLDFTARPISCSSIINALFSSPPLLCSKRPQLHPPSVVSLMPWRGEGDILTKRKHAANVMLTG